MIDYRQAYREIADSDLAPWLPELEQIITDVLAPGRHGHLQEWQQAINDLPTIKTQRYDLNQDWIQVTAAKPLSDEQHEQLRRSLVTLMPWRKGPFQVFDVALDTEWRSDMKWNRLKDHIDDLQDRVVLDVGSGSGYHCFRMAGAGARLVIGIEPMLRSVFQFYLIKHYLPELAIHQLPLTLEQLPAHIPVFDTVFSMGVLYHRRSPIDHLVMLKECLRPGGQLVLETLIVEKDFGPLLFPRDRYAKMRNVWFIPSPDLLQQWLKRVGFDSIELVDINQTSSEEQRSTEWTLKQSLADFLDPDDSSKTIEGYPAPCRAIVVANKPKK